MYGQVDGYPFYNVIKLYSYDACLPYKKQTQVDLMTWIVKSLEPFFRVPYDLIHFRVNFQNVPEI